MNTLFGYSRLAHALHSGNSGISTGAVARHSGMTHLFDRETGRTACGRQRGRMTVVLVPENVTEQTWIARIFLCTQCQAAVKTNTTTTTTKEITAP